jgi:hypothetical protein
LAAELIYSKRTGKYSLLSAGNGGIGKEKCDYHNGMWFQWQFNVYRQDLKNLLGAYFMQIVQAKLKSLPRKLIRHTEPFVLLYK